MSHYIAQVNYTDQGITNIKDLPNRLDKARALLREMGGNFQQVYLTMGGHDMVVIYESPDDATAASHRDAAYMAHPIACWGDPSQTDLHLDWFRRFSEAMAPFSTGGVYLNFEPNEGQERVRAGYGEAKYARLVALKDKWDPGNLFRVNQNIRPSRT